MKMTAERQMKWVLKVSGHILRCKADWQTDPEAVCEELNLRRWSGLGTPMRGGRWEAADVRDVMTLLEAL